MVLDTRSVVSKLPHSIEGFFFLSSMGEDGEETLQAIRSKFMQVYRLRADKAPPLVKLRFEGGRIEGDTPFVAAQT